MTRIQKYDNDLKIGAESYLTRVDVVCEEPLECRFSVLRSMQEKEVYGVYSGEDVASSEWGPQFLESEPVLDSWYDESVKNFKKYYNDLAHLLKQSLIDILGREGPLYFGYSGSEQLKFSVEPAEFVAGPFELPPYAKTTQWKHDDKVFEPRRESVIGLLASFGLSRTDAEEVIRCVGMAP